MVGQLGAEGRGCVFSSRLMALDWKVGHLLLLGVVDIVNDNQDHFDPF